MTPNPQTQNLYFPWEAGLTHWIAYNTEVVPPTGFACFVAKVALGVSWLESRVFLVG